MILSHTALGLLALLLLLPCSARPLPEGFVPPWAIGASIEEIVGGAENRQIIESSKTIQVYRIFSFEPPRAATARISGYPALPKPVSFPLVDADRMVASVLNPWAYQTALMCIYDPGVLFRFTAGESTFDFVVCFSCGELIMYRDGQVVRRPARYATTKVRYSSSCKREFARFAKRAFPKDREIQALP